MSKKNKITLDLLLNNTPIEIEVPGVGPVAYRIPTKRDRIEARKNAMKNPHWDNLTEVEKVNEIVASLVIQILEEPKVKYEDYLNAPEDKIQAIVDMVSVDLTNREEALRKKRSKPLEDFLKRMKVSPQGISTGS